MMLAEGSRISSLTRTKGFKEDTILAWLPADGACMPAARIVRIWSSETGSSV